MDTGWLDAVWAITPFLLAGVFFYFVLRVILRADRTERRVYSEIEAEERARLGLPPKAER